MKRQFLITIPAICFLMLSFSLTGYAQKGEKTIDQEFSWDGENEEKTIYLNVENGAEKLRMNFDGKISEGSFLLTIYDPNGNKEGGFSLVCSDAEGAGSHVHIYESDGEGGHHHHEHHGSGSNVDVHVDSDGDSKRKIKRKSINKNKSKNKSKNKKNYSYSSSNSDSKGSKGVMKKTISDPVAGTWKFVLEAKEATGTLSAVVKQD